MTTHDSPAPAPQMNVTQALAATAGIAKFQTLAIVAALVERGAVDQQ